MAAMTQTQTNTPARPDSDAVSVRTPVPDLIGTRTAPTTRTHPLPDSYPDPVSHPDPGTGTEGDPTRTRTQTPTRTPEPVPATINDHDESGTDDTRTRTQTRTRTRVTREREIDIRRRAARAVAYPGGVLARRRAANEAHRRATEEAINRGVDAELLLLEAQAAGDLEAADAGEDEEPRARWEQFAAGWPQTLLTIAVAILASVGQIQFAREKGAVGMIWLLGHDITPYFAPAVLDLSVAALYARGMYVAVRYKASPWLPWAAGTAIGAFSVYTNTEHEHAALLFAGASAVGVISWIVALLLKYWNLPHVKARRASAKPRLLTSSLVFASRATAKRAWTISRRRPITACAAAMAKAGEVISERDLVIRAAELFNTVYADRVLAELDQLGAPAAKEEGKAAQAAWLARREQALQRADIVAWDAVDMMLGLPVIQREGIRVNRVSYLEPPAPTPPAAVPPRPRPRGEVPAGTPTPELSAGDPAPDRQPEPGREEVIIVERPSGNKYRNWVRLDAIPGLPVIDPAIRCECGPDAAGRCGETLARHVERRGEQIRDFIKATPAWATRPERIMKPDVAEALNLGGGGAMEVVWLLNQLRIVAAQQRTGEASAS